MTAIGMGGFITIASSYFGGGWSSMQNSTNPVSLGLSIDRDELDANAIVNTGGPSSSVLFPNAAKSSGLFYFKMI